MSKSTYTQGHSPEVLAAHQQRTVANSAQFLLPHLKPYFALLDVGCGPGTITSGFVEYLSSGSATGIDITDSVISQNTSTFPISKYPNLKFEVGNILDGLKYEDESFDVVFTNQTILHLPDPVKAMTEARLVLKTGGMLAMRESDHLSWYPFLPGLENYVEDMSKMLRSTDAPGFCRARELHAWARKAGFKRCRIIAGGSASISSTEEERKWVAEIHIGRLRSQGVGGKLRELGIAGDKKIEEMVEDFEKWRQDDDGWLAIWQCEVIAFK